MAEDQNRTYDAQYLLRLPSSMRDRIKATAAENNRSMNAEIVATLEEKYPAPQIIGREDYENFLQWMEVQADALDDPAGAERLKANIEQLRQFALHGGPVPDFNPDQNN